MLIAPLDGVGRDYPLSIEKLCPVLSYYVVKDWREGCERCKQILRYGGMGHTMSIHSQNEQVILEFGLKKPAFRIVVNTPTTHGSIGLTTGLDPAMTLGCGGYGGNITSDNISPRHLLNIKRLAYEITPGGQPVRASSAGAGAARARRPGDRVRRPAAGRARRAAGAAGHQRRGADAPDRRVPRVARLRGDRRPAAGARRRSANRRWPPPSKRLVRSADRRSNSSAKRTCGSRFRPAANCSSPSARSSRPRRAISAKQHRVFTVAPWRGIEPRIAATAEPS